MEGLFSAASSYSVAIGVIIKLLILRDCCKPNVVIIDFIDNDRIIEFQVDTLDNNSLVRVKRLIRVLEKPL